MTNNLGYTGGMMMDQPNLDTTLIKIFLNTVKEGDLQQIINEIENWGLGIGDWGLGIGPNPQSPIPNPQSPSPIINQNKTNNMLK
jgi:hypothetical protein